MKKKMTFWSLREKALRSSNPIKAKYFKKKYYKMLKENTAWVPLSCEIKGVPTLPHGIKSIMVSKKAVIGSDCTILHNVTIGSNTFDDSKNCGFPVVGDNVFIGAGAIIVGGVHIGNNVRIGAGCIICEDVPDNATVVMPKPIIIEHSEPRNNTFKLVKN